MRILLTSIALLIAVIPASAISRYNAANMSCAEAKSRIRQEGAVILRFRSKMNPSVPRFGRFVLHVGFCTPAEIAEVTYIPTADTDNCPVRECQTTDFDDFDIWKRH